ncbi:chemotaxis-specific protein-glutamate methyltransferase CheB [Aquitalea sp. ASV11]|uniref:chemotaxis-specific protein-glutamate methyltransferase CheB n=1 Tax=Aquitalea sp. ASV11 TaxID=2795103 RepID=UPI0018EDFBA3|nr:chemotaxis-specific protein-glutamate methyltransferase CheB [Aquitalea sp. ASV11]
MGSKKIKVLVVDDSALMRRHLTTLFGEQEDMLTETAHNGKEAIAKLMEWEPDVITLDVNMPQMDGLQALALIMAARPTPVVMVSSITRVGAMATLEALALGAVDVVTKPEGTISLNIGSIRDELIVKTRAAASARLGKIAQQPAMDTVPQRPRRLSQPTATAPVDDGEISGMVLIGVSTGGPKTLELILPQLPADFPHPVVVVQHMPAGFTQSFAERMDRYCVLPVQEVHAAMPLRGGHIYIARGGADLQLSRRKSLVMATPRPADPAVLWHPSVSVMVRSAMDCLPASHLTGVMLTGMGYDGADEMTQLHQLGGRTIAESEETAIVFGMPMELARRGGASVVLPAHAIASQLIAWCQQGEKRHGAQEKCHAGY